MMRRIDTIALAGFAYLALVAVSIWAADLGGEALRAQWRLRPAAVANGEIWRLATAHLVHLSHRHMVMNLLGIALVAATLSPVLTLGGLVRATLASAATISLGWMVLRAPEASYVGFSGITHGLFAWGGLVLVAQRPRWFGWLVLGALAAKLGHEALLGPVPGASAAIGGRISLLSHALGTLGGALAAPGPVRARAIVLALAVLAVTAQAGGPGG